VDDESRDRSADQRVIAEAPVVEPTATEEPRRRRGAVVVWLVAVTGLALFVAVGTATVRTGFRLRSERSLPVTELWARFADELAHDGPATLVRVGVYGAVALVLACSALGLWLALTADEGGRGSRRA
jgi:hypothetical protein